MAPRFPFVAVDAPAERADELCALLFELGASGVEQRDEDTHPVGLERLRLDATPDPSEPGAWPRLELESRDEPSEPRQLRPLDTIKAEAAARASSAPASTGRVTLIACFASRNEAEQALLAVREAEPELEAHRGEVVGDEWRERYKIAFAPFQLTRSVTIVPPWIAEPPVPEASRSRVLWLDPGRAFGTGLHATTGLIAEILEERAEALRGQRVLDVGTGSGILALLALELGAAGAVALDNDADAIAVALANAARNGLADRVEASDTPVALLQESFSWVLCNIELRVLCALAPGVSARVARGGTLVLSGLLEPQLEAVLGVYVGASGCGLELENQRVRQTGEDRWAALVLRRPS
jgi:ribosomal protein L11 methyltransferase